MIYHSMLVLVAIYCLRFSMVSWHLCELHHLSLVLVHSTRTPFVSKEKGIRNSVQMHFSGRKHTRYAIVDKSKLVNHRMAIHCTLEWVLVVSVFRVQQGYQWFSQHFDQLHGTSIPNQCIVHDHLNHTLFLQHAKYEFQNSLKYQFEN